MSNGSEACCALQICCNNLASAEKALAKILSDNINGETSGPYEDVAACVLKHFDLAPKGTADVFKKIGELAQAHKHG